MSVSELEICNLALTEIGASTITNLFPADGSTRASVCKLHYPRIKRKLFSLYSWKFTLEKAKGNRLVAAPQSEYLYEYVLPSDAMKAAPIKVFLSAEPGALPFNAYSVFGGNILTNAEAIWVNYTHDTEESSWPEYFVDLVAVALAAKICNAITGDDSMRRELKRDAWGDNPNIPGGLYAQARVANFRDTPPAVVQDFTLLNARHGSPGGVSFNQGT